MASKETKDTPSEDQAVTEDPQDTGRADTAEPAEPADTGEPAETGEPADTADVVLPEQLEAERLVEITLTGDDVWSGTFDGTPLVGPNQSTWSDTDHFELYVPPGQHVLAVHVQDIGGIISGLIAQVKVDGVVVSQTGDGTWRAVNTDPGPGWDQPSFSTATWNSEATCVETQPWTWQRPGAPVHYPVDLRPTDSMWVWFDADCMGSRGDAWFRYELMVP